MRKLITLIIGFFMILEQTGFAQVAPQLGVPAYLRAIAPVADQFRPVHLRSITPDESFSTLEVALDQGDANNLSDSQLRVMAAQLTKYFMIGLRLPNSIFWVNLRPDAPDQIIDPYLAKTDVGRILLEADLQLKKDLARFTDPGTREGKDYWDKLYRKAETLFGAEDMEIPAVMRPWIVPGEIILGEAENTGYIYKATLKVMLEEDYLTDALPALSGDPRFKELNEYASGLLRASIIPKLTRQVNASKRYAPLRQVYYSLILAQWFKEKHGSASGIDQKNLKGLTSQQQWSPDSYFDAYKKSVSQGEYRKEQALNTRAGIIVRTYTSGGIVMGAAPGHEVTIQAVPRGSRVISVSTAGNTVVASTGKSQGLRDGGRVVIAIGQLTPDECNSESTIRTYQGMLKSIFGITVLREEIYKSDPQKVPIDKLICSQPKISAVELAERIFQDRAGQNKPIVVWKEANRMYIVDGHHRAAAAALRNDAEVDAEIIEPPVRAQGILSMTRISPGQERSKHIRNIVCEFPDKEPVVLGRISSFDTTKDAVILSFDGGQMEMRDDEPGGPIVLEHGYDVSEGKMKLYELSDCLAVAVWDRSGKGALLYLSPLDDIAETMARILAEFNLKPGDARARELVIKVAAGYFFRDTKIMSNFKKYMASIGIPLSDDAIDISDADKRNIMFDPASGAMFELGDILPGDRAAAQQVRQRAVVYSRERGSVIAGQGRLQKTADGKWRYTEGPVVPESKSGVQRPLVDNSIDKARAAAWLAAHEKDQNGNPTPQLWDMARTILNAIRHISQEEFEQALRESVDDFKAQYNGPYFAVVRESEEGDAKSNLWTLDIACEKGLIVRPSVVSVREGVREAGAPGSREKIADALHKNPGTDILIIDDAAFSGDQLLDTLARCIGPMVEDNKRVTVHIVMPYMTNHAVLQIKESQDRYPNLDVRIYSHRTIETGAELFRRLTKDDAQRYGTLYPYLQSVYRISEAELERKTLTYFEYKIPDSISLLSAPGFGTSGIIDGIVVTTDGMIRETIPFIPPTKPPYTPGYAAWVESVRGSDWRDRVKDGGLEQAVVTQFDLNPPRDTFDNRRSYLPTQEITEDMLPSGYPTLHGHRDPLPLDVPQSIEAIPLVDIEPLRHGNNFVIPASFQDNGRNALVLVGRMRQTDTRRY